MSLLKQKIGVSAKVKKEELIRMSNKSLKKIKINPTFLIGRGSKVGKGRR